jgi:hypothetical protein
MSLDREALNEAFQVVFTQAIVGAVQVHQFKQLPIRKYGSSARGLGKIQRLPDMADDQPKWLFEDRELMPFQRFESRFQVQVRRPPPNQLWANCRFMHA